MRKEIAKLFQVVTPEEIIVSAPEEGIFITMNALLDAGDNVIVQFPCYPALIELPKAIGCKATTWKPEIIENHWHWDISFLEENVNKDTRMIVTNSPHNPTGQLFTEKEYREIIDIAKENDCIVFSDEMYRLLEHRKEDRLPIGSDVYKNVFLCRACQRRWVSAVSELVGRASAKRRFLRKLQNSRITPQSPIAH